MISNIFDRNIVRVLSYFLISPGSRYTRKDVRDKTGMNNVPLDNTLHKLLSLKIIIKENNLLKINNDNIFKELLESIRKEYMYYNVPHKIFNLLIEISDKIGVIDDVKKVYLFGSYSKLIYHDKSDVDIAVVFNVNIKDRNRIEGKIQKIFKKIYKGIEVHFFLDSDMKKKDPLIRDIIKNGKELV